MEGAFGGIDAFVSQFERAVVDRDTGLGADDLMGADGVIGAHMNG